MTPPCFAVVGTGRCGTGYVAAMLRASGLDCGHEQWWSAAGPIRSGLDGDCSWLALPDIEAFRWSGPVLHITRHPVEVVRSFAGIGFFRRDTPWRAFALAHEPSLAAMTEVEACAEWWVRWNRRCAAVAAATVDVEDARLLKVAGKVFGRDLQLTTAVSRGINTRRRADVDQAEVWRLLDGRAEQFGYTP